MIQGLPVFIHMILLSPYVLEGQNYFYRLGRYSDLRINLLATPSQFAYHKSVAYCGFRPRLQRRARP